MKEKCTECGGSGERSHESNSPYTRPCWQCKSTGYITKKSMMPNLAPIRLTQERVSNMMKGFGSYPHPMVTNSKKKNNLTPEQELALRNRLLALTGKVIDQDTEEVREQYNSIEDALKQITKDIKKK